jgi:hypothetical protein
MLVLKIRAVVDADIQSANLDYLNGKFSINDTDAVV